MNRQKLHSGAIAVLALVPLTLAASCVSESNAGAAAVAGSGGTLAESARQPRHATYKCGADGSLTIENLFSSVRLVDPEGESVELPASPASQQSRYGQAPYALVLDGKEALYMKNGREPLNCSR